MDSPFPVNLESNLDAATAHMKVLANRSRLLVMYKITRKPHTVSELIDVTGMSQTALSHQLAKLREDGMVHTQRQGKAVYYSIASCQLSELVEHIFYKFQCWADTK